jgi:hypothetical protein
MAATLGAACYGAVASVALAPGEGAPGGDGAGLSLGLADELGAGLALAEADAEGDGATLGDGLVVALGVADGVTLGFGVGVGVGVVDFGSRTEPTDVPEPWCPPSNEETGLFVDASIPESAAMARANTTTASPATAIQRRRSVGSPRRSSLQRNRLQREGSAGTSVVVAAARALPVWAASHACLAATAAPMKVPVTPNAPDSTAAVTAANALAITWTKLGRTCGRAPPVGGPSVGVGTGGTGTAGRPGDVSEDEDVLVDIAGAVPPANRHMGAAAQSPS